MIIDPQQLEFQTELNDVNRRFADQATQLVDELHSPKGREALGQIYSIFSSGEPSNYEQLVSAANSFISVLDLHPGLLGVPISRIGRPLFPDQPGYSSTTSEEAGQILMLGSICLGIIGQSDSFYQNKLWEIIAGADVVNTLLRNFFTGKFLLLEPTPIPDDLTDFTLDIERRTCVAGIGSALTQFGRAIQGWRPTSHANGITSLDPAHGCAGDLVTVRGRGFGNLQPQNVNIYFPTITGGCKMAHMRRNGWSDIAIEVNVPEGVGTGCVGFVESGPGGVITLTEAASTLFGEVESCLGPLAAQPMRAVFTGLAMGVLQVPCPPCLPGDVNRFVGGPPVIQAFLGERYRQTHREMSNVVDLIPGDILELSWQVENATQVEIMPISVNSQIHELFAVSGPFDPKQGNLIVRWGFNNTLAFATFAWIAAYELHASNACGTVVSTVTVRMHSDLKLPAGGPPFYWGIATAGRQVEGNFHADDWEIFTTDPQILQRLQDIKNVLKLKINPQPAHDALNHWNLIEFVRSVERAQAIGLNAYRFSIEWSRVEPTSGSFDRIALANYQSMVDAVRSRGMEPFVVLNHLSLPAWVSTPPRKTAYTFLVLPGGNDTDPDYQASLRGWERETMDTVNSYVHYVEYVVTNLRDVRFWITFNEPLATTIPAAYVVGIFPPGFFGDQGKSKTAIHNLILAHALAYEAIHAIDQNAQVGITDQWLYCKTLPKEKSAPEQFVYYHQDFLINALVHGNEDVDISLGNPTNQRVLGIKPADWIPHLDFFGLQYYKSVYPWGAAYIPSFIGAQVDLDLTSNTVKYSHQLLNDMGWEICPDGLYESLMKLKGIAKFNGREIPILVAENGTAEIVDHNRSAFITAHLEQLQRARQDGANVFGYFHWSIADNWEWIDGYRQEARFGLFSVDRNSSGLPHSITDGALALAYALEDPPRTIAEAINRFGRYQPNGAAVEHPSSSPYATFHGTLDGRPTTLLLMGPPGYPVPAPLRYMGITGMLFYGDIKRWIRLNGLVWEPGTRTLQFSHPQFTVWPQTPELIFAGVLDQTGQYISGTASEISGNSVVAHNFELSRAPLVGMWQWRMPSGYVLRTLSLSCPEGVWRGRVLVSDLVLVSDFDWSPLESLNVHPMGFTADVFGTNISATLSPGNILTVSPWGATFQRLTVNLPF